MFNGIKVTLLILKVSTGPSLFGKIGVEVITFSGAFLTGTKVTPSITTGFKVLFWIGIKCSLLTLITGFDVTVIGLDLNSGI